MGIIVAAYKHNLLQYILPDPLSNLEWLYWQQTV